MQPLVSVVVPTWNNHSTIEQCIRSICTQKTTDLELIVVNDGSTDDTVSRCKRLAATDPRIVLLHNQGRLGAAAARNVGIRAANGEVVAFIDGDIYADDGWLTELLAPLLSGEADCSGGPDVVPSTDPLVARCVGHSMDSVLTTAGLRYGRARLVHYLPGTGNMAIRRSLLEEVGLFNESFHDSGEDKELLYRVVQRGFRIQYVPRARVWHHRTTSLLVHARKMYRCGVRRVDIWRCLSRTLEIAHVIPAVLALLVLTSPALLASPVTAVRVQMRELLFAAGGLLSLDAAWGAWMLRDLRAVPILPLSTLLVVLGYGFGILRGMLGWLCQTARRST